MNLFDVRWFIPGCDGDGDNLQFIKRPTKRIEIPRLTTNGVSVACIARTARPTKKEARLYRLINCVFFEIHFEIQVEIV